MKAMILAAGLGTRLQPYTAKRPKPLLPILNKPLLLLTISRLKNSGFNPIIINCHHLADQIKTALRDEDSIILQHEEHILGTGGGLRMALKHFGNEPVLVVNGDIYHTIDFADVYHKHCAQNFAVTMVMHDYPRFNNVVVDKTSRIIGFGKNISNISNASKLMAFTGIHIINPDIIKIIPEAVYYPIIDCYRAWLQKGEGIHASEATGHYWHDIGTERDYLDLHAGLILGRIPSYEELPFATPNSPFQIFDNCSLGKNVKILDWACIGSNTRINDNVVLQRTVVWDGARIAVGSTHADTIVT